MPRRRRLASGNLSASFARFDFGLDCRGLICVFSALDIAAVVGSEWFAFAILGGARAVLCMSTTWYEELELASKASLMGPSEIHDEERMCSGDGDAQKE